MTTFTNKIYDLYHNMARWNQNLEADRDEKLKIDFMYTLCAPSFSQFYTLSHSTCISTVSTGDCTESFMCTYTQYYGSEKGWYHFPTNMFKYVHEGGFLYTCTWMT